MDNISAQPFLNTLDGIAPRQEASHNVDRVIRQVQEEDYQKKLDTLEAKEADFEKHKKRETEKLEAKQKALDEREARIKRDRNLIDADKKRVNEQTAQVLQDKAENDARKKELDKLEEQIRQNFDESESKLKLIEDNFEKQKFILNRLLFLEDRTLDNHKNLLDRINDLSQKLADNDVKNDLILEELSKPQSPQVKKKTKTHSNLDQLNLFVSKSETAQPIKVLSSDYIFRLNDGDSYHQCLNIQEFIDTYSHLSRMNENLDEFFSTFEFSFHEEGEPLLEVSFNDLHEDTQNDLLNIFSENT